jgi:hypothetical protein
MILVRNLIRDMLGEETGKITSGKLSNNLGFPAANIPGWYNILGGCVFQDFCSKVYDSFLYNKTNYIY